VRTALVNPFSYFLWHAWRDICFERRTQNLTSVCVLQSHRHQHGALHPGRTRRHSPGVPCTVRQRQGSAQDLSRAFCEQTVSRLSHCCSEVGTIFEGHLPVLNPPKLRPYWEQYQRERARSITISGISYLVLYVMPIGDLQTKIHFSSRETAPT
jgi:hypothetical protein